MPNYKGNPNLKGNKNSGRKSAYEERNKVLAVNLLWYKVRKKIEESKKLTPYEEKLVLSVLPKTIKQKEDLTSDYKPIPILSLTREEKEQVEKI